MPSPPPGTDLSKKRAWISAVTQNRLKRYVPGGGEALEELKGKGGEVNKKGRRRGVLLDAGSSDESPAPYPERKDEWGSFLNILRLVSQSVDHLSLEEERFIAERVHSQLKLEGRLDDLRDLGVVPVEEIHYLYSLIDAGLEYFRTVRTEVSFKACEETKLEMIRHAVICRDLMQKIEKLQKAVQNGSQTAKKRLDDALAELQEVQEVQAEAQYEAEQRLGDLKFLVAQHRG